MWGIGDFFNNIGRGIGQVGHPDKRLERALTGTDRNKDSGVGVLNSV